MKLYREDLALYFVTNEDFFLNRSVEEMVEDAIKGGATIIQYREKKQTFEYRLEKAKKISRICKKYKVPYIINDDIELAKVVSCDGVHVGQADDSIKKAIDYFGDDFIYGVSVTTQEEAQKAQEDGATYLGVGTMFPTTTKDDAVAVSIDTLKEISDTISLPVVTIGGITLDNMKELTPGGIDGVALISAIINNENIKVTCEKLLQEVKKVVRPNTLLLDIDGTLVDSMDFYYTLPETFLRRYNKQITNNELDMIQNMSFYDSVSYLKETYQLTISSTQIAEELIKIIEDFYTHNAIINEDVLNYVINQYKSGVKVLVYSAAYRKNIEEIIKKAEIGYLISEIYGAENFINNKQDQEVLELLLKTHKKIPSEIIGIDDNVTVIKAYDEIGINTIHYKGGESL